MEPESCQWCQVRSQKAEISIIREEKVIPLTSSNTAADFHP